MRSRSVLITAFIIGIACVVTQVRGAVTQSTLLPLDQIKPSGITWTEGQNYEVLTRAPVHSTGKVEVLEFFQYGCPACYATEPHVVLWKRGYGNLATVTRVPVTFRPKLTALARLYYTLEALGRVDVPGQQDAHLEVYDRILRDGVLLMSDDDEESLKYQREFAVSVGIDADAFTRAWRSDAVTQKVKRAEQLGITYKVALTPTFVIAGKYKTDIRQAGDPYRLMHMVTDLSLMSR
jgi:thiol:disulfide interchange protein DsbA